MPWHVCPALVGKLVVFGLRMQSFGISRQEIVALYAKTVKSQCDHLTQEVQEAFVEILKAKFTYAADEVASEKHGSG